MPSDDAKPGLQELIDLFDEASRSPQLVDDGLAKLYDDGKRRYGKLFTARVHNVAKLEEELTDRLMAKRPRNVPTHVHQNYVTAEVEVAVRAVRAQFPTGNWIESSSRDRAKLAAARAREPLVAAMAVGDASPDKVQLVGFAQVQHLRPQYVLRKFFEMNQDVPRDAAKRLKTQAANPGPDALSAYRYALAWLVQKGEKFVTRDMKRLAGAAATGKVVGVVGIGGQRSLFFGDLAAVAEWALTDPSSALAEEMSRLKRDRKSLEALRHDPDSPEDARIHFGQHVGKALHELPLTYLLWLQDLVPDAQRFMVEYGREGGPASGLRVPEAAKNPYYVGRQGKDSLESTVGSKVGDLTPRQRSRVVRFMEKAANSIFANRLRTFTQSAMFRDAESRYLSFLSQQEEAGTEVAANRRLQDGSVKDWYGRGVVEADLGMAEKTMELPGGKTQTRQFAFREAMPGTGRLAGRMAKVPLDEESHRRRSLGLPGRFRTPASVRNNFFAARDLEVDRIKVESENPETGEVALFDAMLRWEERIETTDDPERLGKILDEVNELVRRVPQVRHHKYFDPLVRSWNEKMNALRGRQRFVQEGGTLARRRGLRVSHEDIRDMSAYQPPGQRNDE